MGIQLKQDGPVATVVFENGPLNLLTNEFINDLVAAHQQADNNPETRVIVTRSKNPGMFSNGLDPQYVLDKDQKGREEVFLHIGKLFYGLYSLKRIHVNLIDGPAMAGGAVLALTSDFRFWTEKGKMGFSETKVGLPLPGVLAMAIQQIINPSEWRNCTLLGKNYEAKEALKVGLADMMAPEDQFEEEVIKQLQKLTRFSANVLSHTKKEMRAKVREMGKRFCEDQADLAPFLGTSYLGEGLQALVDQRFPRFKL